MNRGTPVILKADSCVGHTPAACPFCHRAIELEALEPAYLTLQQGSQTVDGLAYDYVAWHKYECPDCCAGLIVRTLNARG